MNRIKGKVWVFGDNINTDQIVPSIFLTESDPKVLIEHAFEGVHIDFAQKVKKGDVIIGGKNFGSGSSREEAVFVIKELGISAIVAVSFSRIYFRNLINQGVPALSVPNITKMFNEGELIEIDMELGKITNVSNNIEKKFTVLPPFIMNLINNEGALNILKKKK